EMGIDENLFDRFPSRGVTPVAVELLPTAQPLTSFEHPEDALYVFGPEDGGLPKAVRLLCHRFVFIPTHHCLNLAAAVNVVLYDRRLKRHLAGRSCSAPSANCSTSTEGRSSQPPLPQVEDVIGDRGSLLFLSE